MEGSDEIKRRVKKRRCMCNVYMFCCNCKYMTWCVCFELWALDMRVGPTNYQVDEGHMREGGP